MPNELENIGLEALFKTEQFAAGYAQYQQMMGQAVQTTNQAATSGINLSQIFNVGLGTALGGFVANAGAAVIDTLKGIASGAIENVTVLQNTAVYNLASLIENRAKRNGNAVENRFE